MALHRIARLLYCLCSYKSLFSLDFTNSENTDYRSAGLEFESSGQEITATVDAGQLISFADVLFSVEFLNLTAVEKLDVVTVFASFDTVDDLSDITIVGDYTIRGGIPNSFALLPCYPNPFNARATIQYDLPTDTLIRFRYSMLPARRSRHC